MIRPLPFLLGMLVATWPGPPRHGTGPDQGAPRPADATGLLGDPAEEMDPVDHLERRMAEVAAEIRGSAVTLEYTAPEPSGGARRVATGVVLNDRGEILSVNIAPPPPSAEPVVARDASGHRHPTHWVAADPDTGLTLLRVEADDLRPVGAIARAAVLGTTALVVGSPFGLDHSIKRGNVAGLNRRLDVGPRPLGGLIQVEAMLHPGDSGALLTNLEGEWLGLIRSGLATAPGLGAPGLGFAIPAADAIWVAEQLRTGRRVERAYLGVKFDPSPGDVPGVILSEVLADTPAARAGLQPGDRVAAMGGRPIRVPTDLIDRLDRTLANTEVPIEVVRGPRRLRLTVRTTPRPPHASPVPAPASNPPEPAPPDPAAERLNHLERRLQDLERLERRIESLEHREAELARRLEGEAH